MKKALFGSGFVLAALVLMAGVIPAAQAAGNKYSFVARGVVTDVDLVEKTMKMDITKVEGKGKVDMEGSNIEFQIGEAKVFKVVNGKDKRGTYKNFVIGQEVGIKGVAKADDNDTYVITFARIHDRAFSVIGLLEKLDKDAKTMKIQVLSSSYKPATYKKGTDITMHYNDDTTFRNNTTAVSIGDVNADAQRVKVAGVVESGNTWKVKTLWDKYKGK